MKINPSDIVKNVTVRGTTFVLCRDGKIYSVTNLFHLEVRWEVKGYMDDIEREAVQKLKSAE